MISARSLLFAPAALALAACSSGPAEEPPLDGYWTVQGDASRLSFVTVKGGQVAEAHTFSDLSGTVTEDGEAEVSIGLASVQTNVDIRNERMQEFLFETATYPTATVTATIDPALFTALKTGETTVQPLTATLDLHGVQGEITGDVAVTRIAVDKVQVETVTPIIVDAASFGLDTGVEKLGELAGLDSITGQVPVSFSLVFGHE